MWRSLGLALVLCLLPGGGAESQSQSSFCKQPPAWSIRNQNPMLNASGTVTVVALLQASWYLCILQASRFEDLRVKLEKEGYFSISYVIINHQGIDSRLKHIHLKNRVSDHIPVYQQEEHQTDVWTLLNGNKDDFLIYDRCGRLVYHLGLPYSFLSFPYVEEAIKIAYCEEKCGNCSLRTLEDEDFCKNVSLATAEKTAEAPHPHSTDNHKHGHQQLGGSERSENKQPEAPDNPVLSPLGHHHRRELMPNGQQEQGHSESWFMSESEALQLSLAQRKLCHRGCKNQLLCKFPADSQLAPTSCCCYCRHLVFGTKASSVTCQCAESLPSLCSCQGDWVGEKVIESCQCRLPPAAWQIRQQQKPTETNRDWSWNRAQKWKWPSN